MSYMKCPECGHRTELKESDLCLMTICEQCRLCGNRNLWDKWAESERICLEWRKAWDSLETELERTRKALEIAKDGLQRIADAPIGYCMFAEETLEQITALEQKDK